MDLKILKLLVTVFLFSRVTHQLTTPEERCAISESGFVCLDCFKRGTCLLNEEDKTYTVIFESMCPSTPSQFYCDDTISDTQDFGSCFPLFATATNCSCSSSTWCISDVNNPTVLLHSEDDMPITDTPCLFPLLDLNTCSCASILESCILIDDPNDNCTSFFVLNGNMLIPSSCKDGSCFNQTACGCVITPLMCPADCPLVDDPNDNCTSYFACSGENLVPVSCADSTCFDQESCGCVVKETTSTTTTTLAPECPFIDDPNDDCAKYFIYDGKTLTALTCTDTLCYDPDACGCVERGSTTTSTTETNLMCSEDCPFVNDPNGSCESYFICSGSTLIPINCTNPLCFDEASCACVENGGSSSSTTTTTTTSTVTTTKTTTTTHLTCPSDCPFVDDASSCASYFLCNGDDLVPISCGKNLCFDQESCACVETS